MSQTPRTNSHLSASPTQAQIQVGLSPQQKSFAEALGLAVAAKWREASSTVKDSFAREEILAEGKLPEDKGG